MTKIEIKDFFNAIRNGDLLRVRELVNSNRDFITVCNFAPPKKDDGQSGLQVAFKTGNFEIAKFLIEHGADVNFIEKSEINEWNTPVLHDCIMATIFNTYTLQKDKTIFEKAFSVLQLMLSKNADPNATDSYGNTSLHRAILDARQMIDNPRADLNDNILLLQIRKVFHVLITAGADPESSNPKRPSPKSMASNFRLDNYELWEDKTNA